MSDFTDRSTSETEKDRGPVGRRDYIFSAVGHVLLLVLGLLTFTGSAVSPMGGDGAVSVRMVNLDPSSSTMLQETSVPDEQVEAIPEEVPDEQIEEIPEEQPDEQVQVIPEEQPDEQIEEIPDEQVEEIPDEQVEEVQEAVQTDTQTGDEYATLSGTGTAGAGVPGPGTYESRVFNAIRRNFRTSVEPERSYRIVYRVNPDGSVEVEIVRDSGTSAFDRAVDNALSMAQIPPMPPGRSSPVVLSIEFLPPE